MFQNLSISSRLVFLLGLLVASLIVTSLLLINRIKNHHKLMGKQVVLIEDLAKTGLAVKTFGDLKYWLTDLVVGQSGNSEQRAKAARARLDTQLADLASDFPDALAGLPTQVSELMHDAMQAAAAYGDGDYLVGNAMMARGRAHILAVDARLSVLVAQLQEDAKSVARTALSETERDIRSAMLTVVLVTVAAAALTFLIIRSIVVPLRQLTGVIHAMSAGKMDAQIPSTSRGEIGDMAR
ncbi:MAG: HAMP domain-containing protein, partial [Candidatus Tectomicrobia bacterium]